MVYQRLSSIRQTWRAMTPTNPNPLRRAYQQLAQWVERTPERALDQAYDAILMIRSIEGEHFDGQRINAHSKGYSQSVQQYFDGEVNKYLRIARVRLQEFRASETFLNLSDRKALGFNANQYRSAESDRAGIILEKLQFIDTVINAYSNPEASIPPSSALIPVPKKTPIVADFPITSLGQNLDRNASLPGRSSSNGQGSAELLRTASKDQPSTSSKRSEPGATSSNEPQPSYANQTSFVPRSILGTFDRIRQELDPNAEQQVVTNFRFSKAKTVSALRFILILILVPLLVHHLAKAFIVGPLVDHFRRDTIENLFVNEDLEEEAFVELERFEHRLQFRQMIHQAPTLSREEIEHKLEERAEEIADSFRWRGSNAVKNIFSDTLAAITSVLILVFSRREVEILKLFIDRLVYGLSDSAKAFVIILFTDIFVGFHSPHGWEVILEGIAQHFGLPASRSFIFLFIATFPVILDTVFKYWIFRYLNRISPSAVATYRNMNE